MDNAISELSDKLRHPSDIKTKLDSNLGSAIDSHHQYEHGFVKLLSERYKSIHNLSQRISQMSEDIETFNKTKQEGFHILKDFTMLVKDYKTIKMVCLAHQNFLKIKTFAENLKTVRDPCADDDLEKYHEKIYAKEEFMCELQLYNYNLSTDNFKSITGYINDIEKDILEFTSTLLHIMENFIENYEMVPLVDEIIKKEGRRDELTRMAQDGEKTKDPELHEISKMYPKYLTRKIKNLDSKVREVINSSIRKKFSSLSEDPLMINKLDFVLEDIGFIHKNIMLDIFPFTDFLLVYHKNLKNLIDSRIDNFDAGEILALIEFTTNYYNIMEARYSKVAEALGPRLIESESVLLEKYSRTASIKLQEWIENITAMEVEKFTSRDIELNRDEENKLISPGFINLLQIIKLQLEPVSFNKKIFTFITNTVKKHCMTFKDKILNEIERDFEPYCDGKSRPGFEDYCIMFGNSGLKLTQYITSLPQCQNDEIRELGNIFMGILKSCNYYLSEFVIFTCKPVIKQIFTQDWYDNNSTKVLKITIEDFLQDYHVTMCSFSFVTFIYELCRCIVEAYIQQLKSKKAVIRSEAGDILKKDYEKLFDVFSMYAKESDIEESLGNMLKLVPLISTESEEMFLVELKTLKYAKIGLDYSIVKNILNNRSDIDEEVRKNLLVKSKMLFKQDEGPKKQNILRKILRK